MKKISGWFTAILLAAVVVAAFTVPTKEKLEQQLSAAYDSSSHVNISESKIRILFPIATICSYTVTGKARETNYKTSNGTPLALATILKQGVYVGLFGRFWKWN